MKFLHCIAFACAPNTLKLLLTAALSPNSEWQSCPQLCRMQEVHNLLRLVIPDNLHFGCQVIFQFLLGKRTSLSSYLSDTSLSFWTSCATLASTPLASSAIVKPSSGGALLSLEAKTALLACLWFPTCNCSLRRATLLMPCFQSD